MKRLLILSGALMLLAACGATSSAEESASGASVLETKALAMCGESTCTGNTYVYYYGCYIGQRDTCGECSSGSFNTVNCQPIPSSSNFHACGLDADVTEATNHYVFDHRYDSNCPVYGSAYLNRTFYVVIPGAGQQFSACGIGCPNGAVALAYANKSSTADWNGCGSSPYETERNSTTCVKPAGSALWVCGDSCPSGYVVQGHAYSNNCRPSDLSPTNVDNQTYCVPSGS
jgi:hypothetical protein